jgi:hypothetical protein
MRQSIAFVLAILSFVSVFYSVGKLMMFLSTPVKLTFETKLLTTLLENKDLLKATTFAICCDAIWAILFIFQHSCMKSDVVKNFWVKLRLQNAERSIYNIASALSLIVRLVLVSMVDKLIIFYYIYSASCKTGSQRQLITYGTLISVRRRLGGGRSLFFTDCCGL